MGNHLIVHVVVWGRFVKVVWMMAGICINRIMGEIILRSVGMFLLGRQSSKDISLRRGGVVRRVVHLLLVFAFLPFFWVVFFLGFPLRKDVSWESERKEEVKDEEGEG